MPKKPNKAIGQACQVAWQDFLSCSQLSQDITLLGWATYWLIGLHSPCAATQYDQPRFCYAAVRSFDLRLLHTLHSSTRGYQRVLQSLHPLKQLLEDLKRLQESSRVMQTSVGIDLKPAPAHSRSPGSAGSPTQLRHWPMPGLCLAALCCSEVLGQVLALQLLLGKVGIRMRTKRHLKNLTKFLRNPMERGSANTRLTRLFLFSYPLKFLNKTPSGIHGVVVSDAGRWVQASELSQQGGLKRSSACPLFGTTCAHECARKEKRKRKKRECTP